MRLLPALILLPLGAHAGQFTTLHSFTGGADGGNPHGALIMAGGLLYGTTQAGGTSDGGTVFSLDPATGTETVLYSFTGGSDGGQPAAGLTLRGGKLYGTTMNGGTSGGGTVFTVDPATGTETVLHSFTGFSDGYAPNSVMREHGGILFGTTASGGPNGAGTVFRIDPASGAESVLFGFGAAGTGQYPQGIVFYRGSLYGTAADGGQQREESAGVIFKIDPMTGQDETLYSFDSPGHTPDGLNPYAGLVVNGGMLYGTTYYGGASCCGTVFSFNTAAGAEKLIVSFAGGDGGYPFAAPIYNSGLLYGITSFGGDNGCGGSGCGTIYKLNPATGAAETLHFFTGNADGGNPEAPLLFSKGAIYGTTFDGNDSGHGSVFRISP